MDLSLLGWFVLSGLGTAIGAPAIYLVRRPSARLLDTLLGFTAGVMLAAAMFSLLVPALDSGSLPMVVSGFALGFLVLALVDAVLPHMHERYRERGIARTMPAETTSRATLLLGAMTVHNIPEGMAVGVAFAAGGAEAGIPVALAIGIQNIPEGFVAVAPLARHVRDTWKLVVVGAATGLVEPIAATAAYLAAGLVAGWLPGALAFASGAMIYVVVDELAPESQTHGFERNASLALLVGFSLMMVLDRAFA